MFNLFDKIIIGIAAVLFSILGLFMIYMQFGGLLK
jgi:hypothetical protein